jgi:hypothetical protein
MGRFFKKTSFLGLIISITIIGSGVSEAVVHHQACKSSCASPACKAELAKLGKNCKQCCNDKKMPQAKKDNCIKRCG